jgi:hypothetical protein
MIKIIAYKIPPLDITPNVSDSIQDTDSKKPINLAIDNFPRAANELTQPNEIGS